MKILTIRQMTMRVREARSPTLAGSRAPAADLDIAVPVQTGRVAVAQARRAVRC